MGRENKKEAVAALHRAQILAAAQDLFRAKGFAQTSIEDISKSASYSRRTIYAYYEGKEDILHHLILQGLISLRDNLAEAVKQKGFLSMYEAICAAMTAYYRQYPYSMQTVMHAPAAGLQQEAAGASPAKERSAAAGEDETGPAAAQAGSAALRQIFHLGEEINALLADAIRKGQQEGIVRGELHPLLTVYLLSAELHALLELHGTKGTYICSSLGLREEDLLRYGFEQALCGIVKTQGRSGSRPNTKAGAEHEG